MTGKIDRQLDVLTARSVDVVSREELRGKLEASLKSGRPLRVKYGADPSAPDIHLGHVVGLNKLREFQDFGHTVVFVIGDFTGMIGDPSGRSETRKPLSRDVVLANAKTYQDQVFKVLDPGRTEIRFNSEWCSPLGFADVLKLSVHVTVAQLLSREDFANRFGANHPISLVEFLYPLVQAYDSVMTDADVEIGGTDQLFNLLMGRDLQKAFGKAQQAVITLPLLEGLDGVRKMSKSLDNYIGVTEPPREMFGKLMSISDELMWTYHSLLLRKPESSIREMRSAVDSGSRHPRSAKDDLAREVTSFFYGPDAAVAASEEFARVFSEHKMPDVIPDIVIPASERKDGKVWIVALLVAAGLAESNGAARRLVRQGAVRVGDEKIMDEKALVEAPDGVIVRAGKRGFARIVSD